MRFWVLATVAVFAVTEAAAQPPRATDRCIDAHQSAQKSRQQGHYKTARHALRACIAPACPVMLQRDCATWLAELDRLQPTIVVTADDSRGRDIGGIVVYVDDSRQGLTVGGRALEIDPGDHLLRIEAPGYAPARQTVVVVEGVKGRVINFTLRRNVRTARAVAPPRVEPRAPLSDEGETAMTPLTWALASVGVAGVTTFAALAAAGYSQEQELSDCSPNCPSDQVQDVRNLYLAGDIAGAVGIVAGVTAIVLIATPSVPSRPGGPSARLVTNGQGITLQGRF